ncbi:hypothetical protein BLOT_003736 [Blomia tropicalis]|nr:hypothetical protein BLOT_003736 [Blomia tropicalis]
MTKVTEFPPVTYSSSFVSYLIQIIIDLHLEKTKLAHYHMSRHLSIWCHSEADERMNTLATTFNLMMPVLESFTTTVTYTTQKNLIYINI